MSELALQLENASKNEDVVFVEGSSGLGEDLLLAAFHLPVLLRSAATTFLLGPEIKRQLAVERFGPGGFPFDAFDAP